MVDMEGLRRRMRTLEEHVEKCYLDHGNPDPGKEAEQECPHDDFMNCVRSALLEVREIRAVIFGDVKTFPGAITSDHVAPVNSADICTPPDPGTGYGGSSCAAYVKDGTSHSRECRAAHMVAQWESSVATRHSHYHKPCPYPTIDIYRVLELFDVSDPCLQHAVKKLLAAGIRGGGKPFEKDIQEAMDSLTRWADMRAEEKEANRVVLNAR